ncbi:MAG: cache domain-containing protein [Candidatus Aminicenantes bacterium]
MRIPHFSLRKKIILSFLVVIVFGGIITLILGSRLIRNTLIAQAQVKVKHDLSSAWMVFNERVNDIREFVSLTSERKRIEDSLKNNDYALISECLNQLRKKYRLDILNVTDSKGIVVIRTRNPSVTGDDRSQDEIIKKALSEEVASSPQIISREILLREGKDLADKAAIDIKPTPKSAESSKNRETNGMILKAASPILDEENNLLGVLYGGVLINRNYEIVDRVKEMVYREEKYKERETGTATIFQHDLRVSTNVENEDGSRAIGTRVSKKVSDAVLKNGKSYIDRAFVVNDWYITAYEPIKDFKNQIIGILYVGMLEKPYIDTAHKVMITFTFMASMLVILLLVLLYFSTNRIINPLLKIVEATQKIAKGDLSHKVKVNSTDEIGYLAESFNKMTDDLDAANKKLIEWGKTLEKKVEERTKELREMQAHLIQSEKLASLGKLAAGVAHEINNPLGGILIYSHLILEDIDKDTPYYDNLRKIVKETSRCKEIVKGLLEFARPKEPETSIVDINNVVEKALSIIETKTLFQNIKIKKKYSSSLPKITADSAQLQQVFINIIINAAEAMEGNGSLIIETGVNDQEKQIYICFQDTGPGIPDEVKNRLFEPFFTTKEVGKGTGLGLAISYSFIRKHNGTIEVKSKVNEGSTFIVKLPIKDEHKKQ